jgi:lipopolysaccharide transport system ATP-binding protein
LTPLVLEFRYWNLELDAHLNLSLHVYNEHGYMIFNTASVLEPNWHGKAFPAALFRSRCYIPGSLLNAGVHRVELLIVRDEKFIVFRYEDILTFEVMDSPELRGSWHGEWSGAVHPDLKWKTDFVEPS